jgi:membrane fusion protein (multidrug efflux system)
MDVIEKKSNKIQFILILFLSLIIVLLGGLYFFKDYRSSVWTNDAKIDSFTVDISPDILARIVTLDVDEGDIVQKGQQISTLLNDILLARKQESEANIVKLNQEVRVQEAFLEKIRNDYIRAEVGIQDEVITYQDFDHRQKDFEAQTAKLDFARANLVHAEKMLKVIKAELDHTIVVAPIDGVIAKRWVYKGDVMSPGQTMFTMNDLSRIWVVANLEERKLRHIGIGSEVDIHVDAYPGYVFKGRVFVIQGGAASQFSLIPQDNATGNYTKVEQRIPVKISIEKPENFPKDQPCYLLPGMSCEVKIFRPSSQS